MDIDCETYRNKTHAFNWVYTEEGPLFIDVAMGVDHFEGNNPDVDKNIAPRRKMPGIRTNPWNAFLCKYDKLPVGYSHYINGYPKRDNRSDL